jgi:hypothetical protein
VDIPERDTDPPGRLGSVAHRCPRCGARHAHRRTAKTLVERIGAAVIAVRPYRCLDCGQRFYGRPVHRRASAPDSAQPLRLMESVPVSAGGGVAAPGVVVSTDVEEARSRRRQPRWTVDPGDAPLGASELY